MNKPNEKKENNLTQTRPLPKPNQSKPDFNNQNKTVVKSSNNNQLNKTAKKTFVKKQIGKKTKIKVGGTATRIISIVSIFLAVVISILVIVGVKNEKIYCVNTGDYAPENADCVTCLGYDCNGISIDTSWLQCTWYPLLCGMGNCSLTDCSDERMSLGITFCGFDLCKGATAEFGGEYLAQEKSVTIEKAVENEDYTIDNVKIAFGGGVLDVVEGVFDFDLDALKNNYINANFKQIIMLTIAFTVKTEIAGAYASMTLSGALDNVAVFNNEKTTTAYRGNPKNLVERNKIKQKDIIAPGSYVITAAVAYEPWEFASLVALKCTELKFDAYKVVS